MQKLTHEKKQRASFILQLNVDDNLNFLLFFTVKICNTCKIVLCLPFRTSVGDVYRTVQNATFNECTIANNVREVRKRRLRVKFE